MISSMHKNLFESVNKQLSSYLNDWLHLSTQGYTLPEQQIQATSTQATSTQDIQTSIIRYFHYYKIYARFLDSDRRFLYAETPPSQQTLLLYILIPTPAPALYHLFASLAAYTHLQQQQPSAQRTPLALKWLIEIRPVSSIPSASSATASPQDPQSSTLAQILAEQSQLLTADAGLLLTPDSELQAFVHTTTDTSDGHEQEEPPQLIVGSRGLLQVELTAQTTRVLLPTSYGSIVPDAAWQLLWTLQSIKDAREDIRIDGFYDQLSAPEDEILTALTTLAEQFQISPEYCGGERFLADLHGVQLLYAYFLTPSCSITTLQAPRPGSSTTAERTSLPGYARAQLDFNLVPAQDPLAIFQSLQHHLSEQQEQYSQARLLTAQAPEQTNSKEQIVRATQTALQAAYQQTPLLIPLGNSTPAFSLIQKQLHIPTVAVVFPWLQQSATKKMLAAPLTRLEPLLKTFMLLFALLRERENYL
jgi:Acetylornithine deacetylase/Succinyl-diaminopimelate desuccinylase and related deacylases